MTSETSTRGVARLLAVCAVLLGLFLMHGAPASAADGCHGTMPQAAPMAGGHDHTTMNSSPTPDASGDHPTVQAAPPTGMSGALCVATPAPERMPLPPPGLLAVAVMAVLAAALGGRLWAGASIRRRGPPGGGRDLLLRACIART